MENTFFLSRIWFLKTTVSVFVIYGITASFFLEYLIILLISFFFKKGLAASCIKTFL